MGRMCHKAHLHIVFYNLRTAGVPYGIFFNSFQLLSLRILFFKLREQMCVTKQFDSHFREMKQVCI